MNKLLKAVLYPLAFLFISFMFVLVFTTWEILHEFSFMVFGWVFLFGVLVYIGWSAYNGVEL